MVAVPRRPTERGSERLGTTEEDAETADGGFRGIFEIEKIFERKFFQSRGGEGREFGAIERPGHLAFGVGRFAAASDDEQESALAEKS